MSRGHTLTLDGVTHRFGPVVAVRDVTLEIKAGELVCLLGPSGCGKTTLLRVIGGFLRQSAGCVLIDGAPVDPLPPNHRRVGIVFQNYALFPHMTVAENVAYGLEARGMPRGRIREQVAAMLGLVRMEAFAERYPRELSGGQQQRVALARALAVEPQILLLDEPFGALDKNLRIDMQIEVKRLQREAGITSILVTHDQEEALSIADRIAVLHRGAVAQFASPTEVYDRPATLFVNTFVGAANLLRGRVADGGAAVALDCGAVLPCPVGPELAPGAGVVVTVRPERLGFAAGPARDRLAATVRAVLPLGSLTIHEVELGDGSAIKVMAVRQAGEPALRPGDRVHCEVVSPDACAVFPEEDRERGDA
ncbi:MAG: ABC transporter ATP-binding protein [Candidatus Rokubacteria bacterium]|nr:ABC transporter ATP-binding protein [Candidatus Rokubacteria bacterium]